MAEHEYESVAQLRGSATQATSGDPSAFERANYVQTLHSWSAPTAPTAPGVPRSIRCRDRHPRRERGPHRAHVDDRMSRAGSGHVSTPSSWRSHDRHQRWRASSAKPCSPSSSSVEPVVGAQPSRPGAEHLVRLAARARGPRRLRVLVEARGEHDVELAARVDDVPRARIGSSQS